MRITINSKIVGPVTYWMHDRGGVIRCEQDGRIGVLAEEIRPDNQPVRATPETFEDVCRQLVAEVERREKRSRAKRIRLKLDELGLSQRGAAKKLEIDERTMRRYCSGDLAVPRAVWLALDGLAAQT